MKARVCSVSYLNSSPLVWGFLHGPQRGRVDLRFAIPSVCADLLRAGEVDVGLVPVIELERQPLQMLPGVGIASSGPVRSILLLSKTRAEEIQTLAADVSSRTSVVLAQILLDKKFGAKPAVVPAAPDREAMLETADACLIIGDPALRTEVSLPDLHVYDLGAEWTAWCRLPMVYAVWAARAGFDAMDAARELDESWLYGRERIAEIAQSEYASRSLRADAAFEYLTRNIEWELSDNHLEGLALFRTRARLGGLV